MRRRRIAFLSALLALLTGLVSSGQKRPPADISSELRAALTGYLREKGLPPEEYVAAKFEDHDIVFLGEHHFVKHDVELVRALIPVLYRRGVTDLGIEFGCYELQAEADALVTAPEYDPGRTRRLMYQWGSYWPYVEYLALYRAAWELNRSLPAGEPKFRIVGLDYRPRWELLEERMTPKRWQKVFFRGGRDRHMADVVLDEFVRKGRKALVYSGQYHASTRFAWPVYNFTRKMIVGFEARTMGQLVYRKIRGRAFNICLHYPWETIDGPKSYDYPMGGAVDALMRGFEPKRMGFDVAGSPFGRLRDRRSVYAQTKAKFVFADFCDGYVFSKPFAEYEGCDVDPLFITDESLADAIAHLPNLDIRRKIGTKAQFLAKFKWDADFRRLYPDLE
jgi:hypothetical protein